MINGVRTFEKFQEIVHNILLGWAMYEKIVGTRDESRRARRRRRVALQNLLCAAIADSVCEKSV